jgi:hypothetical protein
LQVLAEREDSSRIKTTLIELAAAISLVRGWLTDAGFVELDYREFDQAEGERADISAMSSWPQASLPP